MFYQLPNSNLFTHRMLFSLREATSEIYGPGSILYHIYFEIYFYSLLFSDLYGCRMIHGHLPHDPWPPAACSFRADVRRASVFGFHRLE
jgi:hypothetical protein